MQPQTFIWHFAFEWHLHEHATLDLFTFSTKKNPFQAYLNVMRARNENASDIVKMFFFSIFWGERIDNIVFFRTQII